MQSLPRIDETKQCQMSKLKVQMKSKAQMTKFENKENVLTLNHFGIHLTFACLREAAPAKAGILTFELGVRCCDERNE